MGSKHYRILDLGFPYLLSSLMAGLSGIYILSRVHMATPISLSNFAFEAFLLAMVSGSLIASRYSNIIGAVLGSLFLVCLRMIMTMAGVNPSIQMAILGFLFIVFLLLNYFYHFIFGFLSRK